MAATRLGAGLLVVLVAALAACRSVETPLDRAAATARTGPPPPAEEAWRWVVDSEVQRGGVEGGLPLPRAGLRVVAGSVPATSGFAPSHQVVEGVPAPIPVGDAVYEGRRVSVEWRVTLRRRGSCAVEVDLVPVLIEGGCPTVLEDLRIVRVVALDEGIAIGVSERAAGAGRALLGAKAPPSGPARLVLRVRGGA